MLTAELGHRIRNILALVGSIASQPLRSSAGLAEADTRLNHRLRALASLQEALQRHGRCRSPRNRHDSAVATRAGRWPCDCERTKRSFDSNRISYRDLLEFFFQIHYPTTRDRQGNDVGASYPSAIFYTTDEQKRVAEDTIADVNASGVWPGKVATEVTPVGDFWEAEPEHQDYLERYPNGYTCHFPRTNWKLPKREDVRNAG